MPNDPHDDQKRLESHQPDDAHRLSDGRQDVGEAFADPNSTDDVRLGRSFEQTSSSAKKHHRPIKEAVAEPFQKAKGNKVIFWIVAGVIVLMIVAFLIGMLPRLERKHQIDTLSDQTKKDQQQPEIEVVKVTRSKSAGGLVVPGTTIPITESSVYARANGYLKKRLVDIGDHVRKGQLLAIIDAPELDEQVRQAEEQVKQAEAQLLQQNTQLALNKVTNDRYQALAARGVFSRQQADQSQADFDAQQASVHAGERNLEAYRANLAHQIALQSYERVTAPFDGIITQRNVDTGDLIQASGAAGSSSPSPVANGSSPSGSQQNASSNTGGSSGNGSNLATPSTGMGGNGGALFTVAQADRLRILVSVPEGYASNIHTGQDAALNFQELPNAVIHATVTRAAGSIDQNSRTELVEVQVDNHKGLMMPGMYAVVTFGNNIVGTAKTSQEPASGPLLITGDAVAIRHDQPTVAVIADGKVKLTPVEIGRDYGSDVEIVSGLREGDLIASTFTDDIIEGASVRTRVDQQQQQTAAPPPTAIKPNPPGGSTQYGDSGIVDQDMQGQNAKPQQKKGGGGGATKAKPKGSSN